MRVGLKFTRLALTTSRDIEKAVTTQFALQKRMPPWPTLAADDISGELEMERA